MKQFHHFFAKNSFAFGTLLGIVTPVVFYLILQAFFQFFPWDALKTWHPHHKLMLLSVAGNFLWLRYYLVGVKQENTGKAILVITLVLVAAYFLFKH